MNEEFYRVKLGDMYVKDFKMITIKDSENHWRVRKEMTLTNFVEDGIPIIKEEAQGLMMLLNKSAIIEKFESEVN